MDISDYRSDADTFSKSVVSLDVFIKFFNSLSSQCGAVVGFVHVQHHCRGRGTGSEGQGIDSPSKGNSHGKKHITSSELHIKHAVAKNSSLRTNMQNFWCHQRSR